MRWVYTIFSVPPFLASINAFIYWVTAWSIIRACTSFTTSDSCRRPLLCKPFTSWIDTHISPASRLRFSAPPIFLNGSLRLCQLLEHSHSRQRRHCQLATGEGHQWFLASHSPSPPKSITTSASRGATGSAAHRGNQCHRMICYSMLPARGIPRFRRVSRPDRTQARDSRITCSRCPGGVRDLCN